MRVKVEPLLAETFAGFGSVVAVPSSANSGATANQATATKYANVSLLGETYPRASPASKSASSDHIHPQMSLFVCNPRQLVSILPANSNSKAFQLHILERHPYTSQTFLPLGLSPNDQEAAYVVIVAPALKTNPDIPDVQRVRAFLARGNQGVTYGVGVWHSPMVVIGSKPITFAVLQWVNGVAKDECTECEMIDGEMHGPLDKEGVLIEFDVRDRVFAKL
ncbi:ureidoglycolate hydrolase [Chytriomyces sp. MP71]|nr:ureidoglycolate hydrolase [Chytriomyces sp. MP71]